MCPAANSSSGKPRVAGPDRMTLAERNLKSSPHVGWRGFGTLPGEPYVAKAGPLLVITLVTLLVAGLVSFLVFVLFELPLPGVVLAMYLVVFAVAHTDLVVFVF